jgi:dihydroorotate dehydrogenase electron transfer subunit
MIEQPTMIRVEEVITESSLAKSFIFRSKIDYQPGQFIMVWVPRLDEKPFSISYHGEDSFGITVALKGRFTKRLHQMKVGDSLGIRGPFGQPFTLKEDPTCIVGGGIGIASLAVLIERLKMSTSGGPVIVQGARTESELLYRTRFRDMMLYTEDGSAGRKGLVTDPLDDLHLRHGFKALYTCGPEPMMVKVFEFARKYNLFLQASLERYIKCAIGLCGQCSCNGLRLCIDGPVVNAETLATLEDFGRFARLRNSQKVTIDEYLKGHA